MKYLTITIIALLLISATSYQNYSITAEMRVQAMAFTHNEDYIIVSQKLNQEFIEASYPYIETLSLPLILLKRGKQGYQIIDSIYGDIQSKTKPLGGISISRQTNRFCISWNDSYVRVYSLQNGIVQQLQKISNNFSLPFTNSSVPYISDDGNYLVVKKLYKWNSQAGQYEEGSELAFFPSSNNGGVSHDLKIFIRIDNNGGMIYTFNGETYSSRRLDLVGNVKLGTNTQVSDLLSDGTRFLVSGLGNKITFSILNGTFLTYVQTIDDFTSNTPFFYVTRNGQYLAVAFTHYRKEILIYKYSDKTKKFQFHKRHSGFNKNQIAVLISEDGKTVVGGAFLQSKSQQTEQLVFYVECSISKCEKCHKNGKTCLTCQESYISRKNNCTCQLPKSEVNGRCVDCLISHCYLCKKLDECLQCGNGYSLIQGVCLCPSYKNISAINGNCVSCDVAGCIKCDVANICSQFADGLSGSQISYTYDVKQKQKEQSQARDNNDPNKELIAEIKHIQLEQTQQNGQITQADTLTITVTKGEEIQALIIFVLFTIIICTCKKCRHMRVKLKMKEELNEQIPEKKEETNYDIDNKMDSSVKASEP